MRLNFVLVYAPFGSGVAIEEEFFQQSAIMAIKHAETFSKQTEPNRVLYRLYLVEENKTRTLIKVY